MTPAEFRAARLALVLSQARLSHIMGVQEHTVGSWEVGRRPIPQWAERFLALLAEQRAGRVIRSYPAITRRAK